MFIEEEKKEEEAPEVVATNGGFKHSKYKVEMDATDLQIIKTWGGSMSFWHGYEDPYMMDNKAVES